MLFLRTENFNKKDVCIFQSVAIVLCAKFCFMSVTQSWDVFFRNANAGAPPGAAYQSPHRPATVTSVLPQVESQGNVEKLVEDHLAVQSLIRAYQVGIPLSQIPRPRTVIAVPATYYILLVIERWREFCASATIILIVFPFSSR